MFSTATLAPAAKPRASCARCWTIWRWRA